MPRIFTHMLTITAMISLMVFLVTHCIQQDEFIEIPNYWMTHTTTLSLSSKTEVIPIDTSSIDYQDAENPVINKVTIENNATNTTQLDVTLLIEAEDNIKVTQISLSKDGGTSWSNWTAFSPVVWEYGLREGDFGERTVMVKVRDAAGNESEVVSASIQYIESEDTESPVIDQLIVADGALTTTTLDVSVLILAHDNIEVIDYRLSASEDFSGISWNPYTGSKVSHSLGGTDPGNRQVYAQVQDAAGNTATLGPVTIEYITTIIYVSKTTGDDANPGTEAEPVATIRKGIELAAENDSTVYVEAETYDEEIVIANTSVFGGFDLTWDMDARTRSTIRAVSSSSQTKTVWFIGSRPSVTFDGFDVYTSPANPSYSYGVAATNNAQVLIKNCLIRGSADDGTTSHYTNGGMLIESTASPTVEDCDILGTVGNTYLGIGIHIRGDGTSPTITKNTIVGSTGTNTSSPNQRYGILVEEGASPHIYLNDSIFGTTTADRYGWGIYLNGCGDAIIEENTEIVGSPEYNGSIGILLDPIAEGAHVQIINNGEIRGLKNGTDTGHGRGIYFRYDFGSLDTTVTIDGNTLIQGGYTGTGTSHGIYFEDVTGGTFNITNNDSILGRTGTADRESYGIYFYNRYNQKNSGVINISGNTNIIGMANDTGTGSYLGGVYFYDYYDNPLSNVELIVDGNTTIQGTNGTADDNSYGIMWNNPVEDCTISVINNNLIQGTVTGNAYGGTFFNHRLKNSTVLIDNNVSLISSVNGTGHAIYVRNQTENCTFTITNNENIVGSENYRGYAVLLQGDVIDSTVDIKNNTLIKGAQSTRGYGIYIDTDSRNNTIDISNNGSIIAVNGDITENSYSYGIYVDNMDGTTSIIDNELILGADSYSSGRVPYGIYFERHTSIEIAKESASTCEVIGTRTSGQGYGIYTARNFNSYPIDVNIHHLDLIQGGAASTSYGIQCESYFKGSFTLDSVSDIVGSIAYNGYGVRFNYANGATFDITNNPGTIIGSSDDDDLHNFSGSYGIRIDTDSNNNLANTYVITGNNEIQGSKVGDSSVGVHIQDLDDRLTKSIKVNNNVLVQGSESGDSSYGAYLRLWRGTGPILEVKQNGTIKGTATGGGDSRGLYVENEPVANNPVTIEGNDLIIGNDGVAGSTCYGIYSYYGGAKLEITNNTAIKGCGSTATSRYAYGICTEGYNYKTINISSNPLIIGCEGDTADTATNAYGIWLWRTNVTESTKIMDNDVIKGTANTNDTYHPKGIYDTYDGGSGPYNKGDLTITGGSEITGTDGNDTYYSRGIHLEGPADTVTINVPKIIGTKGNHTGDAWSIGIYQCRKFDAWNLTATEITGTVGDSTHGSGESCGVFLMEYGDVNYGDISITGSGTLTGVGGSTAYDARGLYIDNDASQDVTINGAMTIIGAGGGGDGSATGYGIYMNGYRDNVSLSGAMTIRGVEGDNATGYGIYMYEYVDSLIIDGAMTIWGVDGAGIDGHGIWIDDYADNIPEITIQNTTSIKGSNGSLTGGNWSYGIYLACDNNEVVNIKDNGDIVGCEGDALSVMGARVEHVEKLSITGNDKILACGGTFTYDAYGLYIQEIVAGADSGDNSITNNTLIQGGTTMTGNNRYAAGIIFNNSINSPFEVSNNTILGTNAAGSSVAETYGISFRGPTGAAPILVKNNTITGSNSGNTSRLPDNNVYLAGVNVEGTADLTLQGNTIVGNTTDPGIGVGSVSLGSVVGRPFTIERNKIWGSKGDVDQAWGVLFYNTSSGLSAPPVIKNNIIKGNNKNGRYGRGIYISSGGSNAFRVVNNVLYGGSGGVTGIGDCSAGFMWNAATPYIINNIIYNYDAPNYNYALREDSGEPIEVKNNILFSKITDAGAQGYYVHDDAGVYISNMGNFTATNINGGAADTVANNDGSVTQDVVVFTDPANDNYATKASSPGINNGLDTSATKYGTVTKDINGTVRSGQYDIGPYNS